MISTMRFNMRCDILEQGIDEYDRNDVDQAKD
jgi:hypothetical protein